MFALFNLFTLFISSDEKRSHIPAHHLPQSLEEPTEDECKIVTQRQAVPESAREEGEEGGRETRFFTTTSDAKIYASLEPNVSVHIPRV